jgi:hypothetical protein
MRRFGPGGLYLNFAGLGEEKEALVRAGYGANYEQLVALKARYDPDNLFRVNHNIKPSGTGSIAAEDFPLGASDSTASPHVGALGRE